MVTSTHMPNAASFTNSSSSASASSTWNSSTSQSRQLQMPSRLARHVLAVSLLLLVLGAALPGMAASDSLPASAAAAANTDCTSMAVSRIAADPDEAVLTTLPRSVHPLARAKFDRGAVADSLPMEHIIMLLQRTPEQEVALQTRIDQMHNHRSPLFHQWLTAERMGACYGVADEDISAVSQWLQTRGFKIDAVPAGKTFLIFSGTAGQVHDAFHTEIHNLDVKGEKHIANMSAPQIPAALAPVVAGIRSLHDFFPKPTMHVTGVAKRDPRTGTLSVFEQAGNPPSLSKAIAGKTPGPLLTYTSNGEELVGPQDFYTIYNEKTLLTGTACAGAACNGAGQTIAVIEETDVCNGQSGTTPDDCNGANDLTAFESQFNLPATTVNYMFGIPAGSYCGDPGVQGPNGSTEEGEADLDLQWSTTVAPGATVDFIACASSATTGGVDLAALYAVNDLASTVSSFSVSYGICEAQLPYSDAPFFFGSNSFYNSLWEQAVAQGQTVLISAGDSGDDTCDRGAEAGTSGWNVNGLASTPFNVVAGGTDFSDNYSNQFAAPPTAYWNTKDTTPYESALSYVPEMTWNGSCGSALIGSYLGFTAEEVCNGDSSLGFDFTTVNASGGGGISSIYSLPTWQSVYGVGLASNFTSASKRNLPDVSLFASNGIWNHGLLFCESDSVTGTGGGTPCVYSKVADGGMMVAGGTSFVAPELNGLMAVINQRWTSGSPAQPTRQGQADYTLYAMADHEYGTAASENTSTSAPSVYTCESNADAISTYSSVFPSCVFHNINRTPVYTNNAAADCAGSNNSSCLQDGNVMPCIAGDTNCYTATGGDAYGLFSISTSSFKPAWYQSAGYSDAVGLGSVNIANLVNNWTSSTWITPFTSTTSVKATPTTVTPSQSTTLAATVTATGRGGVAPPMGTVSFYNTTSGGNCSGGGSLLGTSALVPATACTTSCKAIASLVQTGSQIGGTGAGAQTITACFSGDGANDAASDGTASVTVQAGATANFTLSASPNTVSVAQGASGTSTITVTDVNGFTGSVSLTASGLPTGVTATFNPTSTASTSTLTLAASATAATGTVTVTIKGVSGSLTNTTTLSLTVNASTGTPTITLTPASLAFGNVIVDATSAAKNVTLKNTGTATLNISSIVPSGDFALKTSSKPCGSTLAAAKTCVISVTFTPKALGALTGNITITDNASGSPQTVPLTGTGTVQATLTPATATYAAQTVGTTSAAKVFTLANKQSVALTSIAISTTGEFSVSTTTCTASLAAKTSCKISVVFKPTATGTLSGSLQVADDAFGSPQTSTLKGTGKAAK